LLIDSSDPANFINICTGKTITNGLQVKGGSCNGIPMGDIPASTKMVSAVFIDPKNGEDKAANSAITFQVKIANLAAGTFTNPDVTYYAAPQGLQNGVVVGHTHITVQDMNNQANPTQPLNAEDFAFFKGINDAGDGNGLLSATLAAGLPAGQYRVCSMTSSANHQPVLMPVAQRGAQDDCVRFTVGQGNAGGNNGNANNNNANNNNANNNNANNNNANNNNANNNNGQAANGQAANGQAANGQAANGQAANGQAANGQAANGQAANGQAANGQAANGQQQGQGQGQGQNATRKGRGRGRGRFNRTKFLARDFVA
jgi:transcription initiation factor TFIID subunit 15